MRTLAKTDEDFLEYLDMAATAIAADIVPLTGENRIIAFYGLIKVNENPSIGIKHCYNWRASKNGTY